MNQKEIKILFENLKKNEGQLNPGSISFVQSCKKHFARTNRLSEKQILVLTEIKKYTEGQVIPVTEKLCK